MNSGAGVVTRRFHFFSRRYEFRLFGENFMSLGSRAAAARAARRVSGVAFSFALVVALGCFAVDGRDQRADPSAGGNGLGVSTTATGTTTGPGTGSGAGGGRIMVMDAAPPDVATRVSDGAGLVNDGTVDVGPGICVPDAGGLAPGPYARR